MDEQFYTINEVAKLLQLHHNTVRTLIRNGELAATQVGRQWKIKKTDFEAYTDTRKSRLNDDCGWISASERRPEPPCLVVDCHKNQPRITQSVLHIIDIENRSFWLDDRVMDISMDKKISHLASYGNRVTHWMPLPEPPKEK